MMFRSARWRSDKIKVKAEFMLQFHATQISELNAEALTVSVVTGDIGKPTVRTEKVVVRDGTCRWENAVYEKVKLIRDAKTEKFSCKNLRFVVATSGLFKSEYVGEASIDLANYAMSTKTSIVSFPLKSSKCQAILHISVQRLQNEEDVRWKLDESSWNTFSGSEELKNDDKIINYMKNSPSYGTQSARISDDRKVSIGSDITMMSSLGASSRSTPFHDGANFLQGLSFSSFRGFVFGSSNQKKNVTENNLGDSEKGTTPDNSSQTTLNGDSAEEAADMDIEKSKETISALVRQVDLSELELQTLRKKIVKENKKWQDLSKDLVCLKDEREALKAECETLKSERNDNFMLDANSNLRQQLQVAQNSNKELMIAVKNLEGMVERMSDNSLQSNEFYVSEQASLDEVIIEQNDEKEASLNLCGEIDTYEREKDIETQMEQLALDYEILKQENHNLCKRLNHKHLEEELKGQNECCSSSVKVNELETKIEMLEREIEVKSDSYVESLSVINELQVHVAILSEEMEHQKREFDLNVAALTQQKLEQEQRAMKAEDALRNSKRKNNRALEKMQKDVQRLSFEMRTTLEANEKTAMKAVAEANLRKDVERMLKEFEKEFHKIKDDYESNLFNLSDQLHFKTDELYAIVAEACSLSRQLETQKKHEEQVVGDLSDQIYHMKIELDRLTNENRILSGRTEIS